MYRSHSARHAASRTSIFFSVYIIRTQIRPPPPYVQCSFEKNRNLRTAPNCASRLLMYQSLSIPIKESMSVCDANENAPSAGTERVGRGNPCISHKRSGESDAQCHMIVKSCHCTSSSNASSKLELKKTN